MAPRTWTDSARLIAFALSAAAITALAAAIPVFAGLYWLRVFTSICMFAAMTQSINIMAGFVGYPAFGNVVFFGLGAYGTAVAVVRFQWPILAGLFAGVMVCAVLVVIVGPPVLRLRGHYFAIATIGLNETMKAIVSNLTNLTGGGMGLSLPVPKVSVEESARDIYWMFLALAVTSIIVAMLMRTTRFGYGCRAIFANEEGAESLGINATYYKTAAWLISALIAGLAGGIYALWIGYIDTPSVFDMTISVKAFVMFLIGGGGTVFGPLIGATLVQLASDLTWSHLLKYHLGLLGIIIMVAAMMILRRVPQRMMEYVLRLSALQRAKT
jgi:branched-chain amino acid transport system permease protein